MDIVERALETYEAREAGREPASAFFARLTANCSTDIDLEPVIKAGYARLRSALRRTTAST